MTRIDIGSRYDSRGRNRPVPFTRAVHAAARRDHLFKGLPLGVVTIGLGLAAWVAVGGMAILIRALIS